MSHIGQLMKIWLKCHRGILRKTSIERNFISFGIRNLCGYLLFRQFYLSRMMYKKDLCVKAYVFSSPELKA